MTTINFESSHHVSVEFPIASPAQRIGAAFIDLFLLFVYFIVIISTLGVNIFFRTSSYSDYLWLLLVKMPWIIYNPFCEYFFKGQTLGKHLVGIRIVTATGESPKLKEIFIRWIFKGDFLWISADASIVIWFIMGIASIFFMNLNTKNQRLADTVAGTLAIQTKVKKNYTLSDVLAITDNTSNYEIIYPQVKQFNDDDMLLIKNTILRLREQKPTAATIELAKELCDETALQMGIEPVKDKRLQFLEQVLRDYVASTR
jgi:uncharacterized RDD family membrane protein YckC